MGNLFYNLEVSLLTFLVVMIAIAIIYGIFRAMRTAEIIGELSPTAKAIGGILIAICVLGILLSKPIAKSIVHHSNEKSVNQMDRLLDSLDNY